MEPHPAKGLKAAALAGPAAAAIFVASVVGFAAVRNDGYSHGTKAVSELGAVGAPLAGAFNVAGFVTPGVLVMILALALAARFAGAGGRFGAALLALSGAALALAGVWPVDMAARSSSTSLAHFGAATACGVLWALSLFFTGPALARSRGMRLWGALTPWFGLFLLVNFGWQVAWAAGAPVLPGWGQRIGFAGYMIWIAATGALLAFRRG